MIYMETIGTTLLDIISEYLRQNNTSCGDGVINDRHENMFISYISKTHNTAGIIDIYIIEGSIMCYDKYSGKKDLLFEITLDDKGCCHASIYTDQLTDEVTGWMEELHKKIGTTIIYDDKKGTKVMKGNKVMSTPKHTPIMKEYGIANVLFNEAKKVTTVVFTDGSVTVVKCNARDHYSREAGLCYAIARHVLGNKRANVTRLVRAGCQRSERRNKIIASKIERKNKKKEEHEGEMK